MEKSRYNGGIILCTHKNNPYCSYLYKMDVIYIHQDYVRYIFVHQESPQESLITDYIPCGPRTISEPLDPFCLACRSKLSDFFKSNNHCTQQDINDLLSHICDKVTNMLPKEKDDNFELSLTFNVSTRRVVVQRYDEEVVMELAERLSREMGPKMVPASEGAIKGLERFCYECEYKRKREQKRLNDEEEDASNCVVCLEELKSVEEGKLLVRLPCKHEFHEDCIVEWLRTSHVCPNCRFELPT